MNTSTKENQKLLTLFTANSKQWHAHIDEQFTNSINEIKSGLTTKTTFLQDTVLSMYVANNDIGNEAQSAVQLIRQADEDVTLTQAVNMAFDAFSFNVHLEQVLKAMHQECNFADMYRKNQYYHYVQRFLTQEMILPVGFKFFYRYYSQSNETKEILVTINAEIKVTELFDAVCFGYFMPVGKTEAEKEQLVTHMVNATIANILNDTQAEDIKAKHKNVEIFESTALIAKYHPLVKEKLPTKSI